MSQFTALHYFMAQAPAKPHWFDVPDIPGKPEVPEIKMHTPEDQKIFEDWKFDPICDLPEHIEWAQPKMLKYWESVREWDRENTFNKEIQWRRYWAEKMLAGSGQDSLDVQVLTNKLMEAHETINACCKEIVELKNMLEQARRLQGLQPWIGDKKMKELFSEVMEKIMK